MTIKHTQQKKAQPTSYSAISVEERPLPATVIRANHPTHGDLTITRKAKTGNELKFEFELIGGKGDTINVSHEMFVTKSARNYYGKSAVGYNYIDLGDLQGKGIGCLYHAVASAAAKELGVDLFIVDDVAEEAMRKLCNGAGMTRLFESYSISPKMAERAFSNNAANKGWLIT